MILSSSSSGELITANYICIVIYIAAPNEPSLPFSLCSCLLASIKVGAEDAYHLNLNTGREVLNVLSQTISKRIVSVLPIVSFGRAISVADFVMAVWLV